MTKEISSEIRPLSLDPKEHGKGLLEKAREAWEQFCADIADGIDSYEGYDTDNK